MRTHLRSSKSSLSKTQQNRLIAMCLLQLDKINELEVAARLRSQFDEETIAVLTRMNRRYFNAKRLGGAMADIIRVRVLPTYHERGAAYQDARGTIEEWAKVDDTP